jgi:hypothetical protein
MALLRCGVSERGCFGPLGQRFVARAAFLYTKSQGVHVTGGPCSVITICPALLVLELNPTESAFTLHHSSVGALWWNQLCARGCGLELDWADVASVGQSVLQ